MTPPWSGLLERPPARRPGKPALISLSPGREETVSYVELADRLSRLATWLGRSGVRAGSRVALPLPNAPEAAQAFLALWRLGAVPVPVDPRLKADEVGRFLRDCAPDVFLSFPDTGGPTDVFGPSRKRACLRFGEALACPPLRRRLRRRSPDHPALILHTSATTGGPKAAAISRRALIHRWERMRRWFRLDGDTTTLCLLPLSHVVVNLGLSIHLGGTFLLAPLFDLKTLPLFWRIIALRRVTTFLTVPTIVRLLLRTRGMFPDRDLAGLRLVLSIGGPLRAQEQRSFRRVFGASLLNCYGLKETGLIALQPLQESARVSGSVGRVEPGRLKIRGKGGAWARPGQVGEILARGPGLALGYYRAGKLDRSCWDDGWLHTGDLGRLDERGNLFLHGRCQDLIIRNGLSISPEEVDSVLLRHRAVADAAAVGIAHPVLGERVAACVVASGGGRVPERELIRFCRERLADYKCPEKVRYVARIPRTSLGKVRRRGLRRFFSE